jgi:hypothetical protein
MASLRRSPMVLARPPAASFTTGAVLVVDGGLTIRNA